MAVTILVLIEVANMKQQLKQSPEIELDEAPLMEFIKGVRP